MSLRADRLAKWCRLSGEEHGILLLALVLLPMIALGLRFAGLRRIRALLACRRPLAEIQADAEHALARAAAVARLVAAAARHGPYKAKCLPIALTLAWLLQRRGMATDLRLGVRKAAARFEAHAWIELGGTPLIDGPDVHERFVAFEPVIAIRP